jgi:tetratricopeptide (TPR) repeat protein
VNFEQRRHFYLARFWQFLKQPDRALKAYEDALAHGPGFGAALKNMAFIHASNARFGDAERWYAEVLRLEPNDAQTHFNLGYVRDKLGRQQDAIASFAEAVRLSPMLDRAWYGMGMAHAALGRHADAVDAFGKAAELQPMGAPVWFQLGMACHHAHNPERVREVILHLNRFDPVMARQLIRDTGASDMAYLVKDLAV